MVPARIQSAAHRMRTVMGDNGKPKNKAATNNTSTPNQKVHHWVRGRLGQKVGKGECWDLAELALQQAGAQGSAEQGPMGDDADYVWGDRVELTEVRPGDILQFRDYTVTTRTETHVEFDDGSSSESWKEQKAKRGHHTAVVDHVVDSQTLRVVEQHVKPLGEKVQLHELPTTSKRSTATSYKTTQDLSGKKKPGKVTVTTIVTVTGRVTAYRPKPKAKQ
jgi:hypothetical protein